MPKTYSDIFIKTRNTLRENGIEANALEARLMVACAAGKSTEQLTRDMGLYIDNNMEKVVNAMLARRLAGEPVAYITGIWEFRGLPMEVDRSVLIPRIDTEVLAEEALRYLTGRKMDARVLDLCCGTGCVGLAIAEAMPQSSVVMVDVSREALAVSQRNIRRNKLESRVSVLDADVTQAPPRMLGSFDLVVSNPPYIPSAEIMTLDPSVRDYEPIHALDGGEDGLDFYRAILRNWKDAVRRGAGIMFEVGEGQAEAVKKLLLLSGFHDTATALDTQGVERVVSARI